MTNNQTIDDSVALDGSECLPLRIPDMKDLFDLFMEKVDPRFTLAGQVQLKQDLAAATPAKRAALMERYETALDGFQDWAKEYFRGIKGALGRFRANMESGAKEEELLAAESALETKPS